MQVASEEKLYKLAEFLWQDILPEEEHETEALLARSSLSEMATVIFNCRVHKRKLFTEMLTVRVADR